jgi:hypothetical protein
MASTTCVSNSQHKQAQSNLLSAAVLDEGHGLELFTFWQHISLLVLLPWKAHLAPSNQPTS